MNDFSESGYVDSHAHLEMCSDPENVIQEATKLSVRYILAAGCDIPSSEKAVSFSEDYDQVYACVGIHPHDASSVDDLSISSLVELARTPRTIAIGETGLDFFRNRSPREDQTAAFRRHMELARETGLPLVVHSRDAAHQTLEVLEKHAEGLTIILHCFSLYEEVEECARRGYFMSIAGNITFSNAGALREAVTKIPSDLILTETDSPYLSPVPLRGKQNHPGNVRYVLNELAQLRGESTDDLGAIVMANFKSAFNL